MRFRRVRSRFRWLPTLTSPISVAPPVAASSQVALLDSSQILDHLTGDCTLVRILGDYQVQYTNPGTIVAGDRIQLGILKSQTSDTGAALTVTNANPFEGNESPFFEWLWTRTIFAGSLFTTNVVANGLQQGPLQNGPMPLLDVRRKVRLRMGDALVMVFRPVGGAGTWGFTLDARMLFRLGRK